jgi:DNA-3-methyladenine glycosylase II
MPEVLLHLSSGDPVLARLIDQIGPYAIQYLEPDFETLVRSIVFQQLSGKVARVIFQRLVAAAGGGRLTPENALRLRPSRMHAVGLSQQKVSYIRDLARRTRSGEVDFEALSALADEAVCQALTAVKGIGVWTAQMFLIFALRRPDVLPSADLGIRAAIRNLYGLAELPAPSQVEELARPWRPYATAASWYLWRSLEGQAGL